MPTASVLLHLALQTYPIIDYRAFWSLSIDPPPASYSFEFWWKYTRTCRSSADEAGVSMRTLDRARWQYSKEYRPTPKRAPTSSRFNPPARRRPAYEVGNKSAEMRYRFEQGQSVADVARALGVAYGFAYGVCKRWRASQTGSR